MNKNPQTSKKKKKPNLQAPGAASASDAQNCDLQVFQLCLLITIGSGRISELLII